MNLVQYNDCDTIESIIIAQQNKQVYAFLPITTVRLTHKRAFIEWMIISDWD